MTRSFCVLLLLSGCLLVAEPPPGAEVNLECVDSSCPDGFTCDVIYDVCATTCDDSQPCQNGFTCADGACLDLCEPGDCPRHLACSTETACRISCSENDHCLDDFKCCTATKAQNGRCSGVGTCFIE